MPIANVRGASINYEVLGHSGPWVALSPGGRRALDSVKPLAQRLADAGYRVLIHDRRNCDVSDIVIGADDYESLEEIDRAHAKGKPPVGIGGDSVIERAIVDKNARVGRGVRILNEAGVREADGDGYYIRDGIVIVAKGGVVHDGTVI